MPAGHTVPYGYRKHCKIAERAFHEVVVSTATTKTCRTSL
jgi:hypothetical protein